MELPGVAARSLEEPWARCVWPAADATCHIEQRLQKVCDLVWLLLFDVIRIVSSIKGTS